MIYLLSVANLAITSLLVDIVGILIIVGLTIFIAYRSNKLTTERDRKQVFDTKKDKVEIQIKNFKFRAVQYLCSENTARTPNEEYTLLSLGTEIDQNLYDLTALSEFDIQDTRSENAIKFYNLLNEQLTNYDGFRNKNRKRLLYEDGRISTIEKITMNLLTEVSLFKFKK